MIARVDIDTWSTISGSVMRFFRKGSDGLWYHDAIDVMREGEIKKRQMYKARGRRAAEVRWGRKENVA